jgi:hypothetical protein
LDVSVYRAFSSVSLGIAGVFASSPWPPWLRGAALTGYSLDLPGLIESDLYFVPAPLAASQVPWAAATGIPGALAFGSIRF